MAQSIETIQTAIISSLRSLALSLGLSFPNNLSDYDYRQLLSFVCAQAINSLQQLWDAYTVDIQALIAIASPQTNPWIQNFVINIFQYSATDPQFIQFDTVNIAPYYTTVNAAQRIVTQCAVVPGIFGTTTVRVAKSSPGTPLTALELSALQSALNTVTVPGININAQSDEPDKIFVGGIVTYNGQYSSIIPVNNGTVVQAIQAFLRAIPTTGVVSINSPVGLMKITDLIDAVKAVPGVIDFEPVNVNARKDATPFVPGVYNLITGASWLATQWNSGISGAGYMVTEDAVGYTINDSLTYTPQ